MNATKEIIDQEECFDTKLSLIQNALFRYAHIRLKNYSDAQDIVQKVLCILSEKRADLKLENGSFRAWAFNICRFQIMGFLQSKRRKRTFNFENIDHVIDNNPIGSKEISPIQDIIAREVLSQKSDHLNKCISSLTQKHKDLIKCLFDGLTREQILKKLNITSCSYYSMRRRAFRKIRSIN
jgi:RNA polymerase sigma factor (sigma-70 family)